MRGWLASLLLLGAALVPKCPLCVAAYLMGFGMSTSAAWWAAPLFRPALLALSVAVALGLSVAWYASRSRTFCR